MDPAPKLDPATESALRSLHDIVDPAPISWFPQTWGWVAVAGILACALIAWIAVALRNYRRNAYRREALRLLNAVQENMHAPSSRTEALRTLAELIKRTALAAWPRADVASMTGRPWAAFVEHASKDEADRALEALLADSEYRDRRTLDTLALNSGDEMIAAARRWIERHHVSP